MAINKNKVQLQETVLDSNGHPLSSTDVNPLTSSDCVYMENGMTLEDVMGNDTVIDTPTIMNEDTSFKVGIGDSETKVIDSDVAKMVIEGKTYQNILPKPTTLIMNTDEKEFKINDKIDSSIVLDDNVAEIATVKGQTYVNVVQEESASEYVAIDEELNGQSITTTGKPEGYVKNATLEGMTLVNTIQEPSGADATVLELDADIDAQYATIDNTVQGGIHGAILKGCTLINMNAKNQILSYCQDDKTFTQTQDENYVTITVPKISVPYSSSVIRHETSYDFIEGKTYTVISDTSCVPIDLIYNGEPILSPKSYRFAFVAPKNMAHIDIYYRKYADIGSSVTYKFPKKVVILEGDYTNVDIPYFEGMQSVKMPVLTTTGKNLMLNTNDVKGVSSLQLELNYVDNGFTFTSTNSSWKNVWYDFYLKPNTQYTISYISNLMDCFIFKSKVNTYVSGESIGNFSIKNKDEKNFQLLQGTFTTPNDGFIRIRFTNSQANGSNVVKNIQLEEGTQATPYEPFKSSTLIALDKISIDEIEQNCYYTWDTGVKDTTGGTKYCSGRVNVQGLNKVYVSGVHSNFSFWDSNMVHIGGCPFVNNKIVQDDATNEDGFVNIPSNAVYMKFAYESAKNLDSLYVSKIVNLRKVGDVQDELDLETGKLTQRIGEMVLDGSENWLVYAKKNNICCYHYYTDNKYLVNNYKEYFVTSTLSSISRYGDYFSSNAWGSNMIGAFKEYHSLGKSGIAIFSDVMGINSFKQWLSTNPIEIQLVLKTESVKTVDLNIVDQDGNTVKSIQTHPTLTHISTSSQGLIPNIVIPSQLKYPTIIKPSTTYTVQLKQTTVNSEFPLTINLGGTVMAVPSTKFTITTPETLTSQDVIFTGKNNVIGEVVITEGDTTGIDYRFFEGMSDVKFSDSKFIARGKNLTNLNIMYDNFTKTVSGENRTVFEDGILHLRWNGNPRNATLVQDIFKPKQQYTFSFWCKAPEGYTWQRHMIKIYYTDGTLSALPASHTSDTDYTQQIITSEYGKTIERIGVDLNNQLSINQVQLEEGSVATSYEPYRGVEVQQDVDSIPLTSDMFEQGNITNGKIVGMSYQQLNHNTETIRVKSKTLIPIKPNGKYIIQNLNKTNNRLWGWQYDKNGGYLSSIGNTDEIDMFQFDSKAHYITFALCNQNDSAISPSDLDSLNLTLQEVTDEIVLRSIGDVKDTLNLTTGEYVQRIGEVVLDGKDKGDLYYTKYSMNDHETNTFTNTSVFCVWNIPNKRLGYNTSVTSSFSNCGTSSAFAPTQAKQGIYSDHTLLQNIYIDYGNNNNYTLQEFKTYLQTNPITLQYQLARPIIHKVNLTNTKVIPSYGTETHYETITPSDSLVPNIKIPSTIDYNVAIKPSTQYTIRANTTSAMSVDLGGSVGTLANGKVTLTTPSTLAHNSLKLGNGKAKEVMVVEGSEIKDNVPFFNGMKNVQMGGIKLINIARGATVNGLVTANANKTQFTFTPNQTSWGRIIFDNTLLKPNTKYTVFINIIKNDLQPNADNVLKIQLRQSHTSRCSFVKKGFTGLHKVLMTTVDEDKFNNKDFGLFFVDTDSDSSKQMIIQNPMIIEGDWTHLDEIPYIESEMIIEQPIIRSQGKNLFDVQQFYLRAKNINGVSLDGQTLIFDSRDNTAIASMARDVFDNTVFKPNTQYTITFAQQEDDAESIFGLGFNFLHTDGTTVSHSLDYLGTQTITSAQGKTVKALQLTWKTQAQKRIAKLFNIQLEEGSTATSYEPYKHQTLYSNRVIGYEEGCYYTWDTGTKASAESIASVMSDVEGLNVAYVTHASSNFSFYDKDGVYLSGSMFLSTATDFDKFGFIKIPANAKYMKMACGNSNSSAAKDYHLKATVTGELPLRSLPNGVCDSLNLVTGEYVQRIGEVVLDGSQNLSRYGDEGFYYFGMGLTNVKPYPNGGIAISDALITNENVNWGRRYRVNSSNVGSTLCFSLDGYMTKEQANIYLSQNPITVQYELETPIVRKIGLTAKGNYKEVELNGSEDWRCDINNIDKIQVYIPRLDGQKFYDSVSSYAGVSVFSKYTCDDYHFHTFNVGGYYGFTIGIKPNRLHLADDILSKSFEEVTTLWKQWLSLNPVKVGYLSTNSASLYSNIQKPIFFSNVNVQFMNNNVDIQPTLTLQARSMNSYVMNMMKANARYTLKALNNSGSFTIDGTSYNATTNGTFTSPSTLTNKLMITGQDVQELMIIEGDTTSKQLPYYKGIRSSFDNTDEIEIYSANKNLFDINGDINEKYSNVIGNFENELLDDGGLKANNWTSDHHGRGQILKLKPNTTYTITGTVKNHGAITIHSKTKSRLLYYNYNNTSFVDKYTTKSDETELCFCFATQGDVNKEKAIFYDIQVEESPATTPYQPHKENTTIINMPMQLETVEVVKVDRVKDMEIGAINPDGTNIDNTSRKRLIGYIPVQPNQKIVVNRSVNIFMYDINKNFIEYQASSSNTFTPDNCYFIRFYCAIADTNNITITKQQYKPIALNSLPNGVKDELIINRATSSAKLIQRVGKVVLDGFSGGHDETVAQFNFRKFVIYTGLTSIKVAGQCVTSNNLPCIVNGEVRNTIRLAADGKIVINIDGFSSISEYFNYLKQNPITVYYELAEPVITEIRLKGYPFVYEDGSISLNTDIAPVTRTSYNVNQHQLINSQNETIIRHDKQISDLYDYIEIYLDEIYRMELFKMQLELSL